MDLAPKLLFAAQHHAQLLLLAAVAWSLGRSALRLIHPSVLNGAFRHAIPLSVGLGLLIVILQGLAVAGWLKPVPLAVVAAFGVAMAAAELARCRWRSFFPAARAAWESMPATSRILAAATVVLFVSTLLRPLGPPREWDELMYHLPHAWEWARTGRLTVNEWLRYPWFPYNYNLLYAAALVVGDDVLPHLIHALAGWATGLLLLAWVRQRFGLDRALLATMVWLWLARGLLGNAYIDLGVALFAMLAFVGLDLWREERAGGALLICAFGLGLAAGSKYQALAMLPFFAVAALLARPRPGLVAAAIVAFLLPCAYWYVRNTLLAGDPVAPLGGRFFGFTDWNLADYEMQMADLRRVASWPPRLLWPAAVGLGWGLLRGGRAARLAALFALWAILVWAATSRYDRYLVPAFPVLALFAVLGLEALSAGLARLWRADWIGRAWRGGGVAALVLVLVAAAGSAGLAASWRNLAATPQSRDALLSQQLVGYPMWKYLREHPQGRIYQVGLEDGIYYAPKPIWGDHFGPWRYNDYVRLEAHELRERLLREGFDALLVHAGRADHLVSKRDFAQHFAVRHQEGEVILFSIRKGPLP